MASPDLAFQPVVVAVGLDATTFGEVTPVITAHGARVEVVTNLEAVPEAIDAAPAAVVLAGELRTAKAVKELIPGVTVAVVSDDLGRKAEEAAFSAHIRPLAALDAAAVERFLAEHLPASAPTPTPQSAAPRKGFWHRHRPVAAAGADCGQ